MKSMARIRNSGNLILSVSMYQAIVWTDRTNTKKSIKLADLRVKIWTWDLENKKVWLKSITDEQ